MDRKEEYCDEGYYWAELVHFTKMGKKSEVRRPESDL